MSKFLYFQTIVQFRVPIAEDGTAGSPEIYKKFTTQMKHENAFAPAKKTNTTLVSTKGEDEELE